MQQQMVICLGIASFERRLYRQKRFGLLGCYQPVFAMVIAIEESVYQFTRRGVIIRIDGYLAEHIA